MPAALRLSQFQSTRPRGARRSDMVWALETTVSIHAPAWGATPAPPTKMTRKSFNPRARVGRDLIILIQYHTSGFNPRARVGRDTSLSTALLCSMFQSTRPRGARPGLCLYSAGRYVSIHAPAWGATVPSVLRCRMRCFNPRARVGRDVY